MNEDKIERILNYGRYYKSCDIELGVHGPEMHNSEVYISLFHYMQFNNINARDYDTYNLGNALNRNRAGDMLECKYECQNFKITKYPFSYIQENEVMFEDYTK
jgi:hypothetical protein